MANRRLYDKDGKYVQLDARHCIAREGTGDLTKTWVFRFCGEWISNHETKTRATDEALKWELARVNRMLQEASQ